jgi:hypothetical protein
MNLLLQKVQKMQAKMLRLKSQSRFICHLKRDVLKFAKYIVLVGSYVT